MNLLDRICQDPVPYALVIVLFLMLSLIIGIAVAQDVPLGTFSCKDGLCVISEREVEVIARALEWLQSRVLELQAKPGRT